MRRERLNFGAGRPEPPSPLSPPARPPRAQGRRCRQAPGSAPPAARSSATKSMSRTTRPPPAFFPPRRRRGEWHARRSAQTTNSPHPPQKKTLPASPPHPTPAGNQAKPPPCPRGHRGHQIPGRRRTAAAGGRDELLSATGESFVTLLLLSHAGASPSPSSRHRVSPTRTPRRRPRGHSATSARSPGGIVRATPVPASRVCRAFGGYPPGAGATRRGDTFRVRGSAHVMPRPI